MLKSGIYDLLLNKTLLDQVKDLESERGHAQISNVDESEIPILLSQYLKDLIFSRLKGADSEEFASSDYLEKINTLIRLTLGDEVEPSGTEFPLESLKQLRSVVYDNEPRWLNQRELPHPESTISYSSLFTGSRSEPKLYSELQSEIQTADRIDFLVSFIRWSGLRLILSDLEKFTLDGGKLRVITTTYMGATDPHAIRELNKLKNTEIKVSYDTTFTRLHAKTYIFHRDSGFSTAYVGSSNVSQSALTEGLEWNMKIARKDQSWIMDKIMNTFESYWVSENFEAYSEERFVRALQFEKRKGDHPIYAFFDLRPFPFQKEILDSLEAERKLHGHRRSLVVAATGTGKTMVAAFDYKRFLEEVPQARLLFVAHREEILKQSIGAFRAVLKNNQFGDLYVGSYKASDLNQLFVSIQTFNSADLVSKIPSDYYDYIVIDEFHHAAAESYQKLLTNFKPKFLLGLTATPERMDGQSILSYFEDRIAAEIRLPDAIERNLLVPFQYFGIEDPADLSRLKWSRGGYQTSELNGVYVFSRIAAEKRAGQIVAAMDRYLTDFESTKALGFCVSKEHAVFMAQYFNDAGIPSLALTSDSPGQARVRAKDLLVSGEIKVIFVVDLYNEGVDIPEVNTVLFLRPTESLTVFLQQLGRGLRLSPGKECLTVLDFIGRQNSKYSFEDKFRALLLRRNGSLKKEIAQDFPNLPSRCYIKLEKVPKEIIFENIGRATGQKNYLISLISQYYEIVGKDFELNEFLHFWNNEGRPIRLEDIYRFSGTSFSFLKKQAGIVTPEITDFRWTSQWLNFLPKMANIDSRRWLLLIKETLNHPRKIYSAEEVRLLQMFQITFWGDLSGKDSLDHCLETFESLKSEPAVFHELNAILDHLLDTLSFLDEPVAIGSLNPLDLHCRYTRDQLLVGLGHKNPSTMREGVKYLENINSDIFLITLQKSEKNYSPTTMYKDYSINERLFHWQSQSTTSVTSITGQRYINHRKNRSHILLFVRESKKDTLGTAPYTFLGEADYVSHEGSKPISFIWKLRRPIPARLIEVTSKLGVV